MVFVLHHLQLLLGPCIVLQLGHVTQDAFWYTKHSAWVIAPSQKQIDDS